MGGEDHMSSLNLPVLASILLGVDPTGQYDTETQFVRGEEIATLRQMLLDKYGEQSDIGRALQARDAAALGTAMGQADPPLDGDTEIVRLAQDLLK
jgi:hypothetical protein